MLVSQTHTLQQVVAQAEGDCLVERVFSPFGEHVIIYGCRELEGSLVEAIVQFVAVNQVVDILDYRHQTLGQSVALDFPDDVVEAALRLLVGLDGFPPGIIGLERAPGLRDEQDMLVALVFLLPHSCLEGDDGIDA